MPYSHHLNSPGFLKEEAHMKKLGLCLVVILFAAGTAFSQTIKVNSPKAGDSWLAGNAKLIAWTYSGIPNGAKVKLVLWRNGAKVGDLAVDVPIGSAGAGSWNWLKVGNYLGGTAQAGQGYQIRVRDMGNQYPVAMSTGSFTIESLSDLAGKLQPRVDLGAVIIGTAGGITVKSPAQGLAFKPGDELMVSWDKTPISGYAQVALDVFAPDKKTVIGPIGTSPSSLRDNTGQYEAVIFNARYSGGKDYVIRVSTPDQQHTGWSGTFHVNPLDAVSTTETFTGSYSLSYTSTGQSDWLGCLNKLGTAPDSAPVGFCHAGWVNTLDDPAGPCWTYVGHVYRTVVNPSGIYKGFEVSKAVLHFAVTQGTKQNFYILRRSSSSDAFSAPATTVATISSWGFGPDIAVDITAVVQAWCTGQTPNYGLIIRGADEGYSHNNVKARCILTPPQIVITRTVYK
jgi:hypothetical protein